MKINALMVAIATSTLLLFNGCGGGKLITTTGNYDGVITKASQKLRKNPNNEKQITLMQDAYRKVTERDLSQVTYLKQQAATDASKWVEVFDIYDRMQIREIAILPLLPLYVDRQEVQFDVPNVDAMTIEAKSKASNYLYQKAKKLLNSGEKASARSAYELFDQLMEFSYSYQDAEELRKRAKIKGSTNVITKVENQTGKTLPANFVDDVLSIRNESFTNKWIEYHTVLSSDIAYDYEVKIVATQLLVGQNGQQQRQFREQNRVVVGYQNRKDSQGNTVKVPVYQTVYVQVLEITQYKPIQLVGTLIYTDRRTGQAVAEIPIERSEQWTNVYAKRQGDDRALSQETIAKIQNGEQPYPSNQEFYEIAGKLLNQNLMVLLEENSSYLK